MFKVWRLANSPVHSPIVVKADELFLCRKTAEDCFEAHARHAYGLTMGSHNLNTAAVLT